MFAKGFPLNGLNFIADKKSMIGRKEAPILRGLVYLGCGKLLQASRVNAQLTTERTEM